MMIESYRSPYVWPNPAFPFRVYFNDSKCRIFIIENIHHNWNWLKDYADKFRKSDYFFVYCGWYFSPEFAQEAEKIFSLLGLEKENFFFMFNSSDELCNFEPYGFQGDVINHNAWLDENWVFRPLFLPKIYDAIYVARRSAFKRHYLASKVKRLALVAGINHGNAVVDIPDHVYLNDNPLDASQVSEKINQSYCGLLLSETEGACFSSSEYLLCGVPVVSTKSKGGRDVWYNDYNSIVCEDNEDSVHEAVEYFLKNPRDPLIISKMHTDLAFIFRKKFIDQLGDVFRKYGVSIDSNSYFNHNYFHKMRKSYKPDFQDIFK